MFRLVVAVLAAFGLGALVFGGAAATAAGLVLLAPLVFVFKVMLFVALFGAVSSALSARNSRPRGSWQHSGSVQRRPWHGDEQDERIRRSEVEQFEAWHRMAHAKEEVDSWTPDEV